MPYLFQQLSILRAHEYIRDDEDFYLKLAKADFTLAWDLAGMDAIEADYTDYAAALLTGGVVEEVAGSDKYEIRYPLVTFAGPSSGPAQTIHGYWVERAASPFRYLLAFKFPAPVVLTTAANSIPILPQWRLGTLENT